MSTCAEAAESPWAREIRDRLRLAIGEERYAEIGRRTGFPSETVRRHLTRGAPSLTFVARVCEVWDLNANWVLFGLGPRDRRNLTAHVVCELKPEGLAELLGRLLRSAEATGDGRRGESHVRGAWR